MKKLIIPILAITTFLSLSACGTGRDDRRGPYAHDHHDGDRGPDATVEVTTDTHRGY
jgi:hypothetical protein